MRDASPRWLGLFLIWAFSLVLTGLAGLAPAPSAAQTGTPAVPSGMDIATPPPEEAAPATTAVPAAATQAAPAASPAAGGAGGAVNNLTPVAVPRLAHIHAGACDELGIVVYTLAGLRSYRLEGAGGEDLELTTGTVKASLATLFSEPFSIHVHESVRNKQNYLACAEVGSQPPPPWTPADGLVLQMNEQNNSGFSGFAQLRPDANGGTDVTIVLAATAATAAATPAAPPPPSATYTSPTFGYTIGYGPTWQQTENSTTNGSDRFVLFNGESYITFTGVKGFGGDPKACVDSFVAQLTADPNVSNLRLATDSQGNPLQGGTAATGDYAIYNHDYTFPDRVEPYTLFVGCIPLVPHESVLAIVQNVPTKDYDQQLAARQALLRGLTLPQ
ncbi:MAG TPA: hypothetical protein VFQ80_16310 [Thermomicrobiales bacterium]|nr:hypothetical protein [Thermomicrobiales bacterium]